MHFMWIRLSNLKINHLHFANSRWKKKFAGFHRKCSETVTISRQQLQILCIRSDFSSMWFTMKILKSIFSFSPSVTRTYFTQFHDIQVALRKSVSVQCNESVQTSHPQTNVIKVLFVTECWIMSSILSDSVVEMPVMSRREKSCSKQTQAIVYIELGF